MSASILPFKGKRRKRRGGCDPIEAELARVVFPCVIKVGTRVRGEDRYLSTDGSIGNIGAAVTRDQATVLGGMSFLRCVLDIVVDYYGFRNTEIVPIEGTPENAS